MSEPAADAGPAGRAPSLDDALGHCYRALDRSDRTTAQLLALLTRRGVDDVTAQAAIARLCEIGVVDDARYAANFAHDRRELDAWGSDRIRERLESAGVARELIEAALAERDGATELEAALALLERRLGEPPADDRARNRALGLLIRRGYDSELAYEAVRRFGG